MTKSVAQLCQEQSVSMAQLVEKSGLDENRVAAIVMGRWTPSPTERAKIAGVLGCGVEDIAWGHVTPIQHIYGAGPS